MWRGVNGDTYLGEWTRDKVNGFGVHTYYNGDRY